MILVTGGAGFIGSNFVHSWIAAENTPVINVDKLTPAGNLNNLASLMHHPLHYFVQGDLGDRELIYNLLRKFRPRAIVHLAGEAKTLPLLQTGIHSNFSLLDETLSYWKSLPDSQKQSFRFLNITCGDPFAKDMILKTSFNQLVQSYHQIHGLPALNTTCGTNFGPYQFPDKAIPLMILNALQGNPLSICGDGKQLRHWIYVLDHCEALRCVLAKGKPGDTYPIGTGAEMSMADLVQDICQLLDQIKPDGPHLPHRNLIRHIKNRQPSPYKGLLDSTKILHELGWHARTTFQENLKATVFWYLNNLPWLENVLSGEYRAWVTTHYN